MASREIDTHTEPDLPPGNWTVVLRLSGVLDSPLPRETYTALKGTLPMNTLFGWGTQLCTKLWNPVDGAIYTRFKGDELPGMTVLRDSTTALVLGMRVSGVEAEIQARIAPTNEVNPHPGELPAVFPRLDRVTLEALAIQQELMAAPFEFNAADIDFLQDH